MTYRQPFNNILNHKLHQIGIYTRDEIKKALEIYCEMQGVECEKCKEVFEGIGSICNGKNENGKPQIKRGWMELLKEGPGYEAVKELTSLGYLPKFSEENFYKNVFNSIELMLKLKKINSKTIKQKKIDEMVDKLYLAKNKK
jgi:hypothetical protein